MKKIVTAINNPKLNEELKKEKDLKIIGKDIQYKEAILEILEKNKNINLIIINENLPGEIDLEILIKKIKLINKMIKIIFILEKENNKLEEILIKNQIIDIYYNNKINLKNLIEIINKKEISMEEEIIKLRKIIKENDISNRKIQNKFWRDHFKKKQKTKKDKKENLESNLYLKNNRMLKYKRNNNSKNMSTKIVSFSGNCKSGKSTLALIISQYLSEKNYKVLLIDGDLEKEDLSIILRKEKSRKENKKIISNQRIEKKIFYKNLGSIKFNSKNNFHEKKKIINKITILKTQNKKLAMKKNLIYFNYIKNIIKVNTSKINKNLYFLNGMRDILKYNKIEKINLMFKRLEEDYNFIIIELSKNNKDKINQKVLKKSQINFLILECNLLGIREMQKILQKYIKKWKIDKKTMYMIENKKNIMSINKSLVTEINPFKIKILEVKENKKYRFFLNNYYERKVLLKSKKIKFEIKRIIEKIIYFNN